MISVKKYIRHLILIFLIVMPQIGFSLDLYVPKREYKSDNEKYVLVVEVAEKIQLERCKASLFEIDKDKKRIKKWSRHLLNEKLPYDVLINKGGRNVVTFNGPNSEFGLPEGIPIVIYDESGKVNGCIMNNHLKIPSWKGVYLKSESVYFFDKDNGALIIKMNKNKEMFIFDLDSGVIINKESIKINSEDKEYDQNNFKERLNELIKYGNKTRAKNKIISVEGIEEKYFIKDSNVKCQVTKNKAIFNLKPIHKEYFWNIDSGKSVKIYFIININNFRNKYIITIRTRWGKNKASKPQKGNLNEFLKSKSYFIDYRLDRGNEISFGGDESMRSTKLYLKDNKLMLQIGGQAFLDLFSNKPDRFLFSAYDPMDESTDLRLIWGEIKYN